MSATDRAAGAFQGAADAAGDTKHEVRSGDREAHPQDRAATAHARWLSGQSARNRFERDHFAAAEANLTEGMRQLEKAGKQASQLEAGMSREAGS